MGIIKLAASTPRPLGGPRVRGGGSCVGKGALLGMVCVWGGGQYGGLTASTKLSLPDSGKAGVGECLGRGQGEAGGESDGSRAMVSCSVTAVLLVLYFWQLSSLNSTLSCSGYHASPTVMVVWSGLPCITHSWCSCGQEV